MSYKIYKNHDNIIKKEYIFGFDLDNTLIKFNLKTDKYELLYDENIIMNILNNISKKYNIVIISNQKHNKYDLFEKKIVSFLEYFKNKINISVYVSTKNDIFRKPNIGLVNIIEKDHNNKIKYYCGDALGRKGDFSDTDYKFALNIGISVFSPEKIFLNQQISNKNIIYPKLNEIQYNFNYIPDKKEMIIMIGYPASGKSTISQKIQEVGLRNDIYYKIINRDTLKTMNKCIKETKIGLKYNMNIIIDNTNPSKQDREKFIVIAKKYNYKIIAIILKTSKEISMHNNYYRSFRYKKELIPEIAYNIYKSKYHNPTKDEKIDKILETGVNIYDYYYDKYYY